MASLTHPAPAPASSQASAIGLVGYWRLLVRFWAFVRPYRARFFLAIGLMLLAIPLSQFAVFLTRDVVDRALLATNLPAAQRWDTVLKIVGLQAAFWLASSLLATHREVLTWYVSMRSTFDLRLKFYRHLLRLPIGWIRRRPPGEHLYRATVDIGSPWADPFDPGLTGVIVRQIPELIGALYTVGWGAVLLWLIDPCIAIVLLIYIVPFFCIANYLYGKQREAEFGIRLRAQDELAVLRDSIAGLRTIKSWGRNAYQRLRYAKAAVRTRRQEFRFLAWRIFTSEIGIWGARYGFTIGVTIYLAVRVLQGEATIGDWFVTFALIESLQAPLETVVQLTQRMRIQLVPAQRVLETLDAVPTLADPPDAIPLTKIRGAIAFEDVVLRYNDGKAALDGVSLRIAPGERVGVVGPSGAGKSSLVTALLRQVPLERGSVRVDDVSVDQVQLATLLHQVGIVPQQTYLFDGTLEDNIRLTQWDADPESFTWTCRQAQVDAFANLRPEGYHMPLGEGATISGGERQRVGIARALLRDPRILILDEATASLDPETENEILNTLSRVAQGRTTLVIAHRLKAVRDCDRILVMSEGKIVEQGTHEDLVALNGLYAALWRAQEGNDG